MGTLLSDLEKTVNTIQYGIFKSVTNFQNIKSDVEKFRALASFYSEWSNYIHPICQFTNILYTQSKELNGIFTRGLNGTHERCLPPDSTTTTADPPAAGGNNNDCNMDFVGYGYCENGNTKKCLTNSDCGNSGNCKDVPYPFSYPNGYYSAYSNYESFIINNLNSDYNIAKGYFTNMDAYNKYIENEEGIAVGYISHCVYINFIYYFIIEWTKIN